MQKREKSTTMSSNTVPASLNRAKRQETPFLNCTMAFECSADWHQLTPTNLEDVRHCATCDKNVYFCTTQEELDAHAAQGDCVAFQATRTRQLLGSIRRDTQKPVDREKLRQFIDGI